MSNCKYIIGTREPKVIEETIQECMTTSASWLSSFFSFFKKSKKKDYTVIGIVSPGQESGENTHIVDYLLDSDDISEIYSHILAETKGGSRLCVILYNFDKILQRSGKEKVMSLFQLPCQFIVFTDVDNMKVMWEVGIHGLLRFILQIIHSVYR